MWPVEGSMLWGKTTTTTTTVTGQLFISVKYEINSYIYIFSDSKRSKMSLLEKPELPHALSDPVCHFRCLFGWWTFFMNWISLPCRCYLGITPGSMPLPPHGTKHIVIFIKMNTNGIFFIWLSFLVTLDRSIEFESNCTYSSNFIW